MRSFTAILFAAVAFAPSAFAEIVLTAPIGTTVCQGGQTCQVAWEAGQNAPTLAQCGACDFAVFVGNTQQQTFLQEIQAAVPVATTSSLVFKVDPTIGPNYNGYFVRVQCPIMDPTNPLLPVLAFSHMFSLSGMTGQFNASVAQEISGTVLPTAGTGTATGTTTPTGTTGTSTKTTAPTTSSKTSSTPSSKPNSASSVRVGGGALLALVASAFMLL